MPCAVGGCCIGHIVLGSFVLVSRGRNPVSCTVFRILCHMVTPPPPPQCSLLPAMIPVLGSASCSHAPVNGALACCRSCGSCVLGSSLFFCVLLSCLFSRRVIKFTCPGFLDLLVLCHVVTLLSPEHSFGWCVKRLCPRFLLALCCPGSLVAVNHFSFLFK